MRQLERRGSGLQTLNHALDRHFVACAAVAAAAAVVGQTQSADAAIVYSGIQNLAQDASGGGNYISLVVPPAAGYDINPYVNATHNGFPVQTSPSNLTFFGIYTKSNAAILAGPAVNVGNTPTPTNTGARLNLGDSISSADTFNQGYGQVLMATPNNAGAPWDGATSLSDLKFFGFAMTDPAVNGGNPVYGWVRMTKDAGIPNPAGPSDITYVDWAYDDSGAAILAGQTATGFVPEPTSLAVLALGAIGVTMRRGRGKLRPVA